MTNLADLREKLERATPGPFDHRDGLVRAIRGDMAVPLFEARPVYDPTVKAPTVRFPDGEVIFRAGSHDARHSFAEHQCRENGEALVAILNALPHLLDLLDAKEAREREAKHDGFTAGYLIAVSTLIHQHGCEVEAEDCLRELGETEGILKRLNLDDFDAKPLRKVFREIARKRKLDSRARLALSAGGGAK